MRTTVTLDPDVDALVRSLMEARGLSFKDAVNAAIREGVGSRPSTSVTIQPRDMGPARFDLDRALQLAGELEDEEIVRKLELRK